MEHLQAARDRVQAGGEEAASRYMALATSQQQAVESALAAGLAAFSPNGADDDSTPALSALSQAWESMTQLAKFLSSGDTSKQPSLVVASTEVVMSAVLTTFRHVDVSWKLSCFTDSR